MPQGYLALVLHAHLPFVRHPEAARFLEEHWFFQALTESYIPLVLALERLDRDGVPVRLTVSLSPPLLTMLADDLLKERYAAYLDRLAALAERERERTRGTPFCSLASFYEERLAGVRAAFDRYKGDLLAAFKRLCDAGRVELITTCATHGYLPLMLTREAARAQVQVGVETFARRFGRPPRGFWLPECGYAPGVESLLAACGIRYFIVETHGLLHARPRPQSGVWAPVYVGDTGVAAFARDPESSRQVWDRHVGYPGDFDYREFYRDIGYELDWEYLRPYMPSPDVRTDTGFKYYRITGRGPHKEIYVPAWAAEKAHRHAGHFLESRRLQIQDLARRMDRAPVIVAPYDAELFGHWWYEGPLWIESLCRKLHFDQDVVGMVTPGDYLERFPANQRVSLGHSSWGAGGYSEVWLNPRNDWIYRHLHHMEREMIELTRTHRDAPGATRRLLNQAARELLLAQASDWAFILTTGTATGYAERRLREHIGRFRLLADRVRGGAAVDAAVEEVERRDNIFPFIDYRVYGEGGGRRTRSSRVKPRVLVLSWEFPPRIVGGLGRHVYDLTSALVRQGARVCVLTAPAAGRPGREDVNGVEVLRLPPEALRGQDFLAWVDELNRGLVGLARNLAARGAVFDLVHAHDWMVGTAAEAIASSLGLPVVATVHATEYGRHGGLHNELQRTIHEREARLARLARRIICCSRYMADEVRRLFGAGGKVRVIPNGIDAAGLRCPPDEPVSRSPEPTLLFMGRLVPEKGVQVLLEAMRLLRVKFPGLRLVVAGRGPYEEHLRRLTRAYGLDAAVTFTGFVDGLERNRLLARAHVGVFPSLYEPFGIVALEAMAVEVPVVVGDTGGLTDVVEHGADGFRVPPGRADLLAYYVGILLENPVLAQEMAARAAKKVRMLYDWRSIAEETLEVYTEVTGWRSKDAAAAAGR